jgi:hypothetical protein
VDLVAVEQQDGVRADCNRVSNEMICLGRIDIRCPIILLLPSISLACSTVNLQIPVRDSGGGSLVPSSSVYPGRDHLT